MKWFTIPRQEATISTSINTLDARLRELRRQRAEFDRKFFPAPLLPFEHYMWFDDLPKRPMTTYAQLVVSGPLDVETLREVFPETLIRHPLLGAVIRHRKRDRWEWVPTDRVPYLSVEPEGVPMTFPEGERINLEEEPGLRLWVRHGEEQSRILMQVHHSAADGRGKFNFLTEWLALYARQRGIGVIPAELPPPTWDGLDRRGELPPQIAKWTMTRRVQEWWIRISRVLKNSVELRDSHHDSVPLDHADALAVEHLSEEESALLRRAVKDRNISMNDWLLAQLFQTALAWQEEAETPPDDYLMRLMVPYDIRLPEERRDPAANKVCLKFLTRTVSQIRELEPLARGISEEMEEIRQNDNTIMLKILAKIDRIPRLLRRMVHRSGLKVNAVLSNLGNIPRHYSPPLPVIDEKWRAGDLTVEEVHNTTGVRKGTSIAIGAVGYANKLTLISRADHRGFTPGHIRDFLRRYADAIRNSLPESGTE